MNRASRRVLSSAKSSSAPVEEIPSLYMMSNSASVNGGATLFFTIFTFVRFPVTVPSGCLIEPILRISIRTLE